MPTQPPINANRASPASRVSAQGNRRSQLETSKPQVACRHDLLRNVFEFKYLGHHFQADGDPMHAVEVRMAQARSRFGDMHHIWGAKALNLTLKLGLYIAAVCSMLVHGAEAWRLDDHTLRMLRNWNAKCLSIITGRSVREETIEPSFNLLYHLRSRRLRWLGHILRMEDSRLLRAVVCSAQQPYPAGSIFMDAPPHSSMDHLVKLAGRKKSWSRMVKRLKRAGIAKFVWYT